MKRMSEWPARLASLPGLRLFSSKSSLHWLFLGSGPGSTELPGAKTNRPDGQGSLREPAWGGGPAVRHGRRRRRVPGESPWSHGPSALGHLPKQSRRPGERLRGFRACSHARAWVLSPCSPNLSPPEALGMFFFEHSKKVLLVKQAQRASGSRAGIWASEGFTPGLSY